ncbi:MAG: hypothetical protein WC641_06405 [Patescibacteria group bacterium]
MKNLKPLVIVGALLFFGAGCLQASPAVKSVAEPLVDLPTPASIPTFKGFGELPGITGPVSAGKITLAAELPALTQKITVLRLRTGLPNETELKNVSNSVGIPSGMVGALPETKQFDLAWFDGQEYRWSFHAAERQLVFANLNSKTSPLTVTKLPSNEDIVRAADLFLISRGVNPNLYRQGLVYPDWNLWWRLAQERNFCMNRDTVKMVRALAASIASADGGLPALAKNQCGQAEFPTQQTVRYHALVDGRDVVRGDGSYVSGAEITVDAARSAAVSGFITLYDVPDRSDYPAIGQAQAQQMLMQGGISGVTGDITVQAFDLVSLQVDNSNIQPSAVYLVPALLAKGYRLNADGSKKTVNIVVPLLAR